MVDCGFSIKETERRLQQKEIEPHNIDAILVTHEHSDHIKGVASFSNKYNLPVWLSRGTSLHQSCDKIKSLNLLNTHTSFSIKDISIEPIPVPHDSREATQFVFSANEQRLGLLTDVGHVTEHMLRVYSRCSALMLEFNYDLELLLKGRYPRSLKQRVSGSLGHLSNEQAMSFLEKVGHQYLQTLIVMHRSEENNSDEIIFELLRNQVNLESVKYLIANQESGFEWQTI